MGCRFVEISRRRCRRLRSPLRKTSLSSFSPMASQLLKSTPLVRVSLYNYVPSAAVSSFSLYFFLSLYLWFVDLNFPLRRSQNRASKFQICSSRTSVRRVQGRIAYPLVGSSSFTYLFVAFQGSDWYFSSNNSDWLSINGWFSWICFRSRRKSQQRRCFSPIREYQSQVFEVLKGFFVKVFFLSGLLSWICFWVLGEENVVGFGVKFDF